MRTTLDIEDDVLEAMKELARRQHTSAGKVASRLLRQALSGVGQGPEKESGQELAGFRTFPDRGNLVTDEQVDRLRDDEGI